MCQLARLASAPRRAILFDFYATLVDIKTDEHRLELWNPLAALLSYRGSGLGAEELRDTYLGTVRSRLAVSEEPHPELDVFEVFREVLQRAGCLADDELARTLAQLLRALSIVRLSPFPESRPLLEALGRTFRLGLVSDSQALWLPAELRRTGMDGLFEVVVMSSELGFRKPDPRMFGLALERMGLSPDEVLHVGDSWERDMAGALGAGISGVWICRDAAPRDGLETNRVAVIRDLRELLSLSGTPRPG